MKLQSKEQDFQVNAVQAVVDGFEGQPKNSFRVFTSYSVDLDPGVSM